MGASQSTSSEGAIVSYQWIQLDGPSITLTTDDQQQISFTAPDVQLHVPEVLTFRVIVTDDAGNTDSDTVKVTVYEPDFDPPITTANVSTYTDKGSTRYNYTLTANEPATKYFRVIGALLANGTDAQQWQVYSGTFIFWKKKKDDVTVEYYSVDTAGNIETTIVENL